MTDKRNTIFSDIEFSLYLDDLFRNIRANVIRQRVIPYSAVKLEFLAREINVSVRDVKQLIGE
jgi:hypothetical protein